VDRRAQSHAKLNMMKMRKGDRAFFYHSTSQGCRRHRGSDPRALSGPDRRRGHALGGVDVIAVTPFEKPVTMKDAKTVPELKDMALLNSRGYPCSR